MQERDLPKNPESLKNPFKGQDILSVEQFTRENLDRFLFPLTDWIRSRMEEIRALEEEEKIEEADRQINKLKLLNGKIMTALFYEPSSRTYGSFLSAMQRLGGGIIPIQGTPDQGLIYSSEAKGESRPDTIRTFECYSDVIVIRHPEVGSAKQAADFAEIPIINAGDGTGEHPTQALLDAYTIEDELGRLDHLKVILGGDLKNGRTVHSLSRLLALYPGNELLLVSPQDLRMPEYLTTRLKGKGVKIYETDNIKETIKEADVVYWTRVQKERFAGNTFKEISEVLSRAGYKIDEQNQEIQEMLQALAGHFSQKAYEEVSELYIITPETMSKAKERMILMHPLPRVNEISTLVDEDPRAAYFRQMRKGIPTRMALLLAVLGRVPPEFSS